MNLLKSSRAFAAALTTLISVLATSIATPVSAGADNTIPRDVLEGIEAMRRLPVDGFHIVESQGRLLLVSTNGHYVVSGGRIIDLWNQIEVKSVADVDGTTRIPLARMGIEAAALGGIVAGQAKEQQRVTAFLDPSSPESRKLLPYLRDVGKTYRLEIVFVPAQPSRAGISRALICDPKAAMTFIEQGTVPAPVSDANGCGRKELERARVTVALLGIEALPFTVAPNGATVAGTPKNFAEFVASNREAQ